MARTRQTGRTAAAGRKAQAATAATDKTRKDSDQDAVQADWEDTSEELDVIQDIDGLLDKPATSRSNESEARRRIEMLREDRLLQQALSDVFDL